YIHSINLTGEYLLISNGVCSVSFYITSSCCLVCDGTNVRRFKIINSRFCRCIQGFSIHIARVVNLNLFDSGTINIVESDINAVRWVVNRHVVVQSPFAVTKENRTEGHFSRATWIRICFAAVNGDAERFSFSANGVIQYASIDFTNGCGLQQDQTILVTAVNAGFTGVINNQTTDI